MIVGFYFVGMVEGVVSFVLFVLGVCWMLICMVIVVDIRNNIVFSENMSVNVVLLFLFV